ncbi:Methyltransferase type 11 [Rubrobacter xylanophilus DSM 9941]|uniref:Methyltransferase type 11 n=1 Tax=Rubrobacter xylanophilus (strain DSM 9941 / JCM 11954 / NBRC 16129 / PRD-1) TaxID=266117 RepID=Q1ATQ7_RUBXD|nr:class I SAM-dependent methyltransferase [Rubrobacter xylanophilus]ABG05221.1 Methyltransferase type 11 [Rubrobacter xylanophilus DSM 9941]
MTREIIQGGRRAPPLTRRELEDYHEDLISFCDRHLSLLGDLRGADVLYAGGASPLWLEGLAQRVGEGGSVTALELDPGRVEEAGEALRRDGIRGVRLVAGDVREPPLEPGSFDLAYSSGLFHELRGGERGAEAALESLARLVRPGGRVATDDFVDRGSPAVQLEEERLLADLERELSGDELYGIGPPERLVRLHRRLLGDVRWRLLPPQPLRHLDRLVLSGGEPAGLRRLPLQSAARFRRRWEGLRSRIRREGYTRPATLYVEGRAP